MVWRRSRRRRARNRPSPVRKQPKRRVSRLDWLPRQPARAAPRRQRIERRDSALARRACQPRNYLPLRKPLVRRAAARARRPRQPEAPRHGIQLLGRRDSRVAWKPVPPARTAPVRQPTRGRDTVRAWRPARPGKPHRLTQRLERRTAVRPCRPDQSENPVSSRERPNRLRLRTSAKHRGWGRRQPAAAGLRRDARAVVCRYRPRRPSRALQRDQRRQVDEQRRLANQPPAERMAWRQHQHRRARDDVVILQQSKRGAAA